MLSPYGVKMVGPVLYTYGNEAQKREHLAGILSNDIWWCQGYSEPGSGSGYYRAKEFLFTGDRIAASDAARMGLINHAVSPETLDERVQEYAQQVSRMPARAVQWTKASVNIGHKQLAHIIMDASMAYEALSNMTKDHREVLDAIGDRRKPHFEGN